MEISSNHSNSTAFLTKAKRSIFTLHLRAQWKFYITQSTKNSSLQQCSSSDFFWGGGILSSQPKRDIAKKGNSWKPRDIIIPMVIIYSIISLLNVFVVSFLGRKLQITKLLWLYIYFKWDWNLASYQQQVRNEPIYIYYIYICVCVNSSRKIQLLLALKCCSITEYRTLCSLLAVLHQAYPNGTLLLWLVC